MVSDYSDAAAARWLAVRDSALVGGTGRLVGTGVVEVDGVRYTVQHVVLATGADPIVPPVPGLRELDGIWSTREATAMRAVPERLIVLGGGPTGLELAQVVRRLGGQVALVEGEAHVLAREPAPLGEALAEALRRDGIELVLGVHATGARREGHDFVLGLHARRAPGRNTRGLAPASKAASSCAACGRADDRPQRFGGLHLACPAAAGRASPVRRPRGPTGTPPGSGWSLSRRGLDTSARRLPLRGRNCGRAVAS